MSAGLLVDCYWNLHRRKWSLRAAEGPQKGRVIGHALDVVLEGGVGRVSLAGNARVRREGKKNVHAVIRGRMAEPSVYERLLGAPVEGVVPVTYNPYRDTCFVSPVGDDRPAWKGSARVYMTTRYSMTSGRFPSVVGTAE
jgi:hypothetical protein